ncbi:hypothetical protein ACVWZW_007986 [Bradyrhizobium sp. F1.13.4]
MAELDKVTERPKGRRHVVVVGDVIAVIEPWTGIERKQPQASYPKLCDVIQSLDQPCEVSDTISVAILVGGDVQAVDDGIFVPEIEQCSRPQLRRHAMRKASGSKLTPSGSQPV